MGGAGAPPPRIDRRDARGDQGHHLLPASAPPAAGRATGPKDAEGFRCPWAMPIAQRFRILQEVRSLEVGVTGGAQRRLTKEEGDGIIAQLMERKTLSFDRMRALLKFGDGMRFNLE